MTAQEIHRAKVPGQWICEPISPRCPRYRALRQCALIPRADSRINRIAFRFHSSERSDH